MVINFFSENISFSFPEGMDTQKKNSDAEKKILSVIRKEKKKAGDINFIFCNDKLLLSLNKKFLKHDTLTDILTFQYGSPVGRDLKSRPTEVSGDIFISIPRVKENAKKYKATFENELLRVMIHGVLHLCGYKDKTKDEKKEMRTRENYYLIKF